jgi:hypothetical protein
MGGLVYDPHLLWGADGWVGGMRVPMEGPTAAYNTFSISQPSDRGVREACEDAGCLAWRKGWSMQFDESTALGRAQAAYIRWQSGRTFDEKRTAGGLSVFVFPSGQRCFVEHQTHPQFFRVRRGDWRANLGMIREHTRADDWVEHMQENLDKVRDDQARG